MVSINTLWSGGVIGAPFGGYKHSGFGRTASAESVLEYTQVKSVIVDGSR
jgi:aldehyde dehydrogenase (NAD+)